MKTMIVLVATLSLAAPVFANYGFETRTAGQENESAAAKVIALGVTRAEFIEKVGEPDDVKYSSDGGYERLIYDTTLPYSSYLTATVDLKSGRVVEIEHGEDWKEPRRAEGFRGGLNWENF